MRGCPSPFSSSFLLVRLTFLLFRFVPFSPSLARLDGMSRRGQSLQYGCGLLQLWRQFIATRAAAVARPRLLTDALPDMRVSPVYQSAGCWQFKSPLFMAAFYLGNKSTIITFLEIFDQTSYSNTFYKTKGETLSRFEYQFTRSHNRSRCRLEMFTMKRVLGVRTNYSKRRLIQEKLSAFRHLEVPHSLSQSVSTSVTSSSLFLNVVWNQGKLVARN